MGFQLVHIFGKQILEPFKFLTAYGIGLLHERQLEPGFHRPCVSYALFQFFRAHKIVSVVRLHVNVSGVTQENHYLGAEIADTERCEGVRVKQGLSYERELRVYGPDFRFLPELALEERCGDNQHKYPGRIQRIVCLVYIIDLRYFDTEFEVERGIADYHIVPALRCELLYVALLYVRIGVEVSCHRNRLGVYVKPVRVALVRQVVEEVSHAAAHVEYHFRRLG